MLLIEQLQYATTPRYNFPQPLSDLQLPQKFIELSINSMKNIKGELFQPYYTDFLDFPDKQEENTVPFGKAFTTQLMPLKPISDDTPIIAIDVSSIRVGETESGVICAIRGAVVWNRNKRYQYLRLGPFPFHINEENKREIIDLLRQHHFSTAMSSPLIDIQDKLRNLIERWIQMLVICSSSNSIILWDGSLIAGTSGNPLTIVLHLLKAARQRLNSVLAFSKVTKLRFLGRRIMDLFLKYPPPWIFEVQETSSSSSLRFLGNIYVARFRNNGYSFRLDIDKNIPREEKIEAVQKLLGNDLMFQSYPESLRLAHIYSTFTASEVIGIQRFIAQKFRLKVIARRSIRKMLFGPYGTRSDD